MRNLLGLMAVCLLLVFGTTALNAQTYDYTRTVNNVDPGNPQYGNPAYLVEDSATVAKASQIPEGTQLAIRTDARINPTEQVGQNYTGRLSQDVVGPNGAVLIPRGSTVKMTIEKPAKP